MPKPAFEKFLDDEGLIHARADDLSVNAGLCGIRDDGPESRKSITCQACLSVIRYVQDHRRPNGLPRAT